MEKDGPPRVETVVFYLPDVHSCIPSIDEWQTLTQVYKNAAEDVIARRTALVAAAAALSTDENDKSNDVEIVDSTLGEEEEVAEENFDNDDNVLNKDDEAEGGDQEEEYDDDVDERINDSAVSVSDEAAGAGSEEHMDAEVAEGEELDEDDSNAEGIDENVTDQIGDDIVNEKAQENQNRLSFLTFFYFLDIKWLISPTLVLSFSQSISEIVKWRKDLGESIFVFFFSSSIVSSN